MSEIVEAVKPSTWQTDAGEQRLTYWVTLVSGVGQREVPCYDRRGADLKPDSELPDGWEVKTSKAGKLYLAAPKPAGGGSGGGSKKSYMPRFTDTEEGFRINDERVDRRKALELASARHPDDILAAMNAAEVLFYWLRKNLDVSAPHGARGEPATVSSVSDFMKQGADTPSDGGDGTEYGKPGKQDTGGMPPSASQDSPSPSSTNCHCGQPWGPNTTSTGKKVCLAGHVERFDA